MRRYRIRGSLRAFDWEVEALNLRTTFREGQPALDEGRGGIARQVLDMLVKRDEMDVAVAWIRFRSA